jgi:DNA-directed RNA polymerase specialized sigma subunit
LSDRNPFRLQLVIEGAILRFFRKEDEARRDFDARIEETTIDVEGAFDSYALTCAIERAIEERCADAVWETQP